MEIQQELVSISKRSIALPSIPNHASQLEDRGVKLALGQTVYDPADPDSYSSDCTSSHFQ